MTGFSGESVSYVNRLTHPGIAKTSRLIHFHIDWLTQLAIATASNVDALRETLPCSAPNIVVDRWSRLRVVSDPPSSDGPSRRDVA
jgi:hypothetical protein